MEFFKRIYLYAREKYSILSDKRYSTVAGTLAFFFIMSVIPFSFWIGLLFGRFIYANGSVVLELEIFSSVKGVFEFLSENAVTASKGASLILALTTLYSATNMFYHLRRSGELIYGTEGANGLKIRLSSLVFMFFLIILIVVFAVTLACGYYVFDYLFSASAGKIFSYVHLIISAFTFSYILNLYMCPYKLSVGDAFWGSLITTLLWSVSAIAFSVYLKFTSLNALYGAVSAVIVFILWLYLMMNCFVIGVILNSELVKNERRDSKKF